MMNKGKLGLALGLLGLALVAGLYFSGFLTLALLKLQTPLTLGTYWDYWKVLDLPQLRPHAGKIQAAGAIGFGLPLLGWLGLLYPIFKPRHRATHGEARFASAGDLSRHKMFRDTSRSIVVGKFGGRLVRLPGQQHVILAAPTRSGKGVGIVIPNLLTYSDSMVVLDIKGENYDLTSGWRASQGQRVFRFDPFSPNTHRWNPLSYVRTDPSYRISDLQAIAELLYPDGTDADKFWVSQSRNAFTAFALYLFEDYDDAVKMGFPPEHVRLPTFGRLFRLSSGDGTDLKEYLANLATRPFLGQHARTAFAGLTSQAPETFASILGSFKEPLNKWISPILDAATSGNDFLLTDVRKKKMTIYVTIAPNRLAEARQIINLFFSQLLNLNTDAASLPQNNPDVYRYQCLLLLDEFTAAGRVNIIASTIGHTAGYNMRKLLIIQSMAQLDATYGKEEARTLMTNCALQIIYTPREQRDANDYSEMLGYTTVRRRNRSQSYGQSGNVTFSEAEERRALMLPQELKAMDNDTEVIFYEGIGSPVKCRKIKYYQDRYFKARLMKPVPLPKLAV